MLLKVDMSTVTESVETSIHSATSSQPEIVTVPERIVTVSTRSSLSSDNSLSDSGQILTIQEKLVTISAPLSMEDESTASQAEEEDEKIPPRLPDKFHHYTTKVGWGSILKLGDFMRICNFEIFHYICANKLNFCDFSFGINCENLQNMWQNQDFFSCWLSVVCLVCHIMIYIMPLFFIFTASQ